MARFMMLYKGEATDIADMAPEEVEAVMAKWTAWMESAGSAITNIGTPFGPASSVVDDGSAGTALSLTGYTIIKADDMAGARALTDGHPYLSEGKGNYAVDLFELMPVPLPD